MPGGCTARGLVSQVMCTVYSQGAGVPGNVYSVQPGAGVLGNVQCTARGLVSQVMCTVYSQGAGVPGNVYSAQPGGWCPR
jgi:hypothetical protein